MFMSLPLPVFQVEHDCITWVNASFRNRFPFFKEGMLLKDVLGPFAAENMKMIAKEAGTNFTTMLPDGPSLVCSFQAENEVLFCLRELTVTPPNAYEQLGAMANEMREPLAALQLAFERLTHRWREFDDRKDLFQLESVMQNFFRLVRLCNNASSLADMHLKHKQPEMLSVDIAELCRSVVEQAQPYVASCDMDLLLEGAEKRILINTNKALLERVLYNLISNAVIAQTLGLGNTASPGGLVRLSLAVTDKHVKLTLSDNGPGFSDAALSEAYSMLAAVDEVPVLSPPSRVTFGLPLVKAIAELLGGQFFIGNGASGAAATLFLPRNAKEKLKSYSPLDYTSGFSAAKLELSDIPVGHAGLYVPQTVNQKESPTD